MSRELHCAMGKEHILVDTGERWTYWASNNTSATDAPKPNIRKMICSICGMVKYNPYSPSSTAHP